MTGLDDPEPQNRTNNRYGDIDLLRVKLRSIVSQLAGPVREHYRLMMKLDNPDRRDIEQIINLLLDGETSNAVKKDILTFLFLLFHTQ